MGKGDSRTKKGKRFKGSYGIKRPRKRFSYKTHYNSKNKLYRRKFSKKPQFNQTAADQVITEFALSLISVVDNEHYPSGTAIFIGPHLAITAKHVIEDYISKHKTKTKTTGANQVSVPFNVLAAQTITIGKESYSVLWNAHQIKLCGASDIALLHLNPISELPKGYKPRQIKVDFKIPEIKERIFAFGYTQSTSNTEGQNVHWEHQPCTAVGEVVEVYPQKRDSVSLTFPSFMVNARFDGGMSGGPVFNEAGRLCGIVCSSLPAAEYGDNHSSYVTLLWPAANMDLEIPYESLLDSIPYKFLDLFKKDILDGYNVDKLVVSTDKVGYKLSE